MSPGPSSSEVRLTSIHSVSVSIIIEKSCLAFMSKNASSWPVVPGSYVVGDPKAPVAVCTLTSERLMRPLANQPGVAISGMVYTANLGIARIIVNLTSNTAIRFLLVCGRDSPLFRPGQSIVSLSDHGMDGNKRIKEAAGYEPVLQSVTSDQIEQFRRQIEVVDWTGEEDIEALKQRIRELSARSPGKFLGKPDQGASRTSESFMIIRPGGQREPLIYDPKGYFVISVEPEKEEIVLRHYLPDHTPAHEMRGRGATSILLGLLRDGLVTQLSHAGYLGEELAKAQTALQFGLRYDQDRPLRQREVVEKTVEGAASSAQSQGMPSSPIQKPGMKPPAPPMTLARFRESRVGDRVDFSLSVNIMRGERALSGVFLEMDEAEPFTAYHRSDCQVEVSWAQETRMIMGLESEIVSGALIRIFGKLGANRVVDGEQIIILTRAARIVP
jgi:tetrahydromethanopterin S-methyltransferase subunit A